MLYKHFLFLSSVHRYHKGTRIAFSKNGRSQKQVVQVSQYSLQSQKHPVSKMMDHKNRFSSFRASRFQQSRYCNIPYNPRNRRSTFRPTVPRVQQPRVHRLPHRRQQHVSWNYLNNEFSNGSSRGNWQHPYSRNLYSRNPVAPGVFIRTNPHHCPMTGVQEYRNRNLPRPWLNGYCPHGQNANPLQHGLDNISQAQLLTGHYNRFHNGHNGRGILQQQQVPMQAWEIDDDIESNMTWDDQSQNHGYVPYQENNILWENDVASEDLTERFQTWEDQIHNSWEAYLTENIPTWEDITLEDEIENSLEGEYQTGNSLEDRIENRQPLEDQTEEHPSLENNGLVIVRRFYLGQEIFSLHLGLYMLMYSTPTEQQNELNNDALAEETITKNLRTRTYFTSVKENNWKEKGYSDEEAEMCVICQDEYEDNEKLGRLQCGHEYHADCIQKWLLQKNICPLCKRTALAEQETQVEQQFIM